jgi:quinoprotein glucose dehydrogenase
MIRTASLVLAVLILPLAAAHSQSSRTGDPREWRTYNRDLAGTRYSPLAQINTGNVARLEVAWSYRPADSGGRASAQAVPIVVADRMYLTAGNRVVALEPETGEEIWRHELAIGVPSQRGVAYWPGTEQLAPRIIFTSRNFLIALDAATGEPAVGFGVKGEVDMTVGYGGVPTIYKDIVLVGAQTGEYVPTGAPGDSRAFDARTGRKLWEFHAVPRPGEVGHETWAGESWQGRSGVNVWGFQMTVDEERSLVYMPFGAATDTYYGGDRAGDNLFANSVVAVDAQTGAYRWHFQTVHHDIWDYDLPPAPGLIDIVRDGERIPILAQTGKHSLMFILNRATGDPVFGVEERPVPESDVPGETTSPTQPFPVKPPPLARSTFSPDDIVTAADTTPAHARACLALYERSGGFHTEGMYTPWPYRADGAPPRSTIQFPGATGGTNWGGTASDPVSGYVYTFTHDGGSIGWMQTPPEDYRDAVTREPAGGPYIRGSEAGPGPYQRFAAPAVDAEGRALGTWPCQKPPWGELHAVDANTGEIVWQVTVGITAGLPPEKQHTGRPGFPGPTVTAGGLVFLGATDDARFRAFDAKTGEELWTALLAYSGNSNPITYQGRDGKQYVAIMAAGAGAPNAPPDGQALMVFALR